MSKLLWKETALSIPLENEWTLNLSIREIEWFRDGTRYTNQSAKWVLKKKVDGIIMEQDCSDNRAHIIIDYIIGKQSRIGGPYR